MKKTMLLVFFLTGFLTLLCYAEGNGCKVDDGYVLGTGILRDGKHLIVDIYFAFECFFEPNTPAYEQRDYTEEVIDHLEKCLRKYASNIYIPQYSSDNLCFNQTKFLNEFLDYISENENFNLNAVRITRLEIKKRHDPA